MHALLTCTANVCMQWDLDIKCLTAGPESLASKKGGVAYNILQFTGPSIVVVLHAHLPDGKGNLPLS
jgi:hypothetical protein